MFDLVRDNLGEANVWSFGIGTSVNRHLIEGIARAGQGEAFIVTKPERAAEQAERLRRIIDSPVLTQLKARFDGLGGVRRRAGHAARRDGRPPGGAVGQVARRPCCAPSWCCKGMRPAARHTDVIDAPPTPETMRWR